MKWGSIGRNNVKNNAAALTICFLAFFTLPTNSFAELQNPGFESGTLSPWQTIPPADVATVVGEEGSEFKTYADLGITVTPKVGQYMLRLGSPKQIAEKQNRGDNIVFQTFPSTEGKITFAARIFSWEHRGDDHVRISLKDSTGNNIPGITVTGEQGGALALDLGPGKPQTCSTLPCDFVIDAGKSGDFINTGWVVFELTGLPTDSSNVTLEYTLVGGQNEAHATWVYFDNANSPPFAVFEVSKTDAIEGNVVKLVDKSYDPDAPEDYIAKRTWTIYDPSCDCETTSVDKQEIVIVAADEGVLGVTLTVEDSFGATDTVVSNSTARDNTFVPEVAYVNGDVLMNVLNQEVLVGGTTELVGRFVDPGYEDSHTATWSVDAGSISNENLQEDQAPFVGIGLATATYTAPDSAGTYGGSLSIDDSDGSTKIQTFTIKVLSAAESREPNNNDTQTAPPLKTGGVYLTTLDKPGDVDIFELLQDDGTENGSPIQPGSEIMVKLKNLPADYDLIILRENPDADVGSAPIDFFNFGRSPIDFFNFGRSPIDFFNFGRSPIDFFNFGRSPIDFFNFGRSPIDFFNFGRSPVRSIWLRDPLVNPFESTDLAFNQFPISEVYLDIPTSTDLTKVDVGLSELGLAHLEGSGLAIVDYSTNRGLDPEQLLIRTGNTDVKLYVAIVGNNGSFNPNDPAAFQIESSVPMKVETLVGDACYKSPLVKTTNVTSSSTTLHGTGTSTLFVTQRERYIEIHGLDGWNTFKDQLYSLADDVDGSVISVPSNIYDGWDSNPCSVELANGVATAVRQEILKRKTDNTQFVVFVGNDLIIPQYRTPDATSFSNERLYANDSLLNPDSALYASLFSGYNLTDDYYADDNPDIDNRSVLYIPRFSVARLLETPNEILNVITQFNSSNGVLNLNTAMVAGYDFFKDAAEDIESKLNLANIPVTSLVNNTQDPSNDWSADQLLCQLLGEGYAMNCSNHDFNNFNAHFSHYLGESALAFSNGDGDYFFTRDISDAASNIKTLANSINSTVGCHAGFNAPDGLAADFGPDSPVKPNLDFPQVMAQQGGVFVASTGYGIAGRNSIAATELLLSLYTEELLKGSTAGQALVNAKQRFYTEQGEITVYDEKAVVQTTLFGLPMYAVKLPGNAQNSISSGITGTPYSNLTLNLIDQGQALPALNYEIQKVVKDEGTFFVIDGKHTATAARPIQPKVTQVMSGTDAVHGVLIQNASFIIADNTENFDPVYTRPTTELEQNATEKSFCQDAFWPSEIVKVNSIRSLNQSTLVVIPAQFRCTSGDASVATGVERLYDTLTLEVLRSSSNDFTKPVIHEVDLRDTQTGTTSITVHASDDQSGISQIVVLLINDDGTVTRKESGILSGNGPFSFDLEVNIDTTKILAQVADGAGNVATWTGKGANVRKINVDAGNDKVYSTFFDTSFTATVYGFNDLLKDAAHIYYRWDFGDNKTDSYKVGNLAENSQPTPIVNVDPQGNATFTVTHRFTDTSSNRATLKITDAAGGIGVDDVVLQACGDAADLPNYPDGDLVGCGISNSGSVVTLSLQVAGNITNEFQYRMYFDLTGTSKNSLPDGKSDLTIKWDNDNVTTSGGLNLLSASKSADNKRITVSFDLADVKFRGNYLQWNAETQSGIQAAQGVGFADQMPDGTWFTFELQ